MSGCKQGAALFCAVSIMLAPAAFAEGAVGDSPASPAEIVAAVADCAKAVTPGDFDGKLLEAASWKFGGKGQTQIGGLPVQQYYFAREGGNVINAVQVANQLSTSCLTIAKLANEADVELIRAGIAHQFGAKKLADYAGDEPFKAYVRNVSPTEAEKTMIGDHQRFVVILKAGSPSTVTIQMTPKRAEK